MQERNGSCELNKVLLVAWAVEWRWTRHRGFQLSPARGSKPGSTNDSSSRSR